MTVNDPPVTVTDPPVTVTDPQPSSLFSGIYIPEDDRDAPEKFRGLGVRIEDDVVVTQDSPLILSADCPKEMNDIEQICSRTS